MNDAHAIAAANTNFFIFNYLNVKSIFQIKSPCRRVNRKLTSFRFECEFSGNVTLDAEGACREEESTYRRAHCLCDEASGDRHAGIHARKTYLRAVVSRIEVGNKHIRSIGEKTVIERAVTTTLTGGYPVRGLVRKWCARGCSNSPIAVLSPRPPTRYAPAATPATIRWPWRSMPMPQHTPPSPPRHRATSRISTNRLTAPRRATRGTPHRGYGEMVSCELPKLLARVRFPLPAPLS